MRSTNEEAGGAKGRGDERVRVPTIVITILSGCFDGQGGVDGTVPRTSPREQRLVPKTTGGAKFFGPPLPLRATTEEAGFYDRDASLDLSERAETDGRAE